MDKADGNCDAAIKIFEQELEMMRQHYDFSRYGITGEPYISIDYSI